MNAKRGMRRDGPEELVAGNALDTLLVVCNMHSNMTVEHACTAVDRRHEAENHRWHFVYRCIIMVEYYEEPLVRPKVGLCNNDPHVPVT